MIKKIFSISSIFFTFFLFTNNSKAELQKKIINKLVSTETLSFDFEQTIADKKEIGSCFIKYPLLMKCNYENLKKKVIISNGRTVAIIKKKYKKIYYYPIKKTPLYFILKKEEIINLIEKTQPIEINSKFVQFFYEDKKSNKIKILFDKKSLELKGWKTKDSYSNNVSFIIKNLEINKNIEDNFFKIPKEEDL